MCVCPWKHDGLTVLISVVFFRSKRKCDIYYVHVCEREMYRAEKRKKKGILNR